MFFYPFLRQILFYLLFFFISITLVQASDYEVKIIAPKSLKILLEQNLDLIRNIKTNAGSRDYLALLVSRTSGQAEKLLATQGYFNAKVKIETSVQQNDKTAYIIRISPGPLTKVTSLTISIQGDASRNQDIYKKEWSLKRGDTFTQEAWKNAKSGLLTRIKQYYPLAKIIYSRATVDPYRNTADISITINSGSTIMLGPLEIQGLKRYPKTIIKNMFSLHQGEPYDRDKLNNFEDELSQSGYFISAIVRIGTPNDKNIAPVRVIVTERPRKKLTTGIGYSTDLGPQFNLTYEDLNINHSSWKLEPSTSIARQQQNYNLDFLLPRPSPGLSYAITTAFLRSTLQGNDQTTLVLGGSRIQKTNKIERTLSIQFFLNRQTVPGLPINTSKTLFPNYLLNIINVDNRLLPSKGYYLSLQGGVSRKGIISDQSFIREYLKGAWFIPFYQDNTLILRGDIGAVESQGRNNIPSDLLFTTGGGQTVRGYAYNSLGINQDGAIIGGRFLTIASAEIDHWFTTKWGAAIFYDAGNASDHWHMPLKRGAGIGARWRSPVGAISLDIAHGFEATTPYRIHLAIGYSF